MVWLVCSFGRFPFIKLKRFWKFRLGTWFFHSFHWKILGQNWTSEKVVPFSRWKFSDGTACSIYGFRKGFFFSFRPLSTISSVRKYGGYTERGTSELAMNRSNAKTCLSRGIGGLPNACCWGTLPVCVFLGTEVQRSLESSWIGFQNINSLTIYADKIFSLKTLISVKIAPHIGCNCCQDRNEIIICINKTLFFQREV